MRSRHGDLYSAAQDFLGEPSAWWRIGRPRLHRGGLRGLEGCHSRSRRELMAIAHHSEIEPEYRRGAACRSHRAQLGSRLCFGLCVCDFRSYPGPRLEVLNGELRPCSTRKHKHCYCCGGPSVR
jgi:hypothetical protein